jgi:hypothetical protein
MNSPINVDGKMASLIKGMLKRGDKQSDIAACFLINGGRIAEINTGQRFRDAPVAPLDALPPPGPYPSPYDLWRAKNSIWAARVALQAVSQQLEKAIMVVSNIEGRV